MKQNLVVKHTEVPSSPTETAKELCAMLRHSLFTVTEEAAERSTARNFDKQVTQFLVMWNGPLDGQDMVHFCCRGKSRCCANDTQRADRVAESLLALALGRVPETPAPGKWTKLWSALMFSVFGLCCNGYLYGSVSRWLDVLPVPLVCISFHSSAD